MHSGCTLINWNGRICFFFPLGMFCNIMGGIKIGIVLRVYFSLAL